MLDLIIFYFAAVIAVGAAVMMIMQRNPVASVLYLVVSLVAQAILYVQLNALFVGALLIIIYTGAILVLFLFVIMLLNLRGEHFGGKQSRMGRASKIAITVILFAEMVAIFKQVAIPERIGTQAAAVAEDFGSVEMVASHLFKEYLYPFELTSILLLVAIVGAVVLAKRDKTEKMEDA
ncbi:MAG: NADH-quinone oxidoreductase subunit J [Candidatus Zixiibacteriota bacterium]|nr:MAG: NADH-quinone oxidoreductase subunit J [candidate division Zixibacteria bacterium]HDL04034.1 NADH-quinone oxidoreductase subunit J [candidate division Zixibacteria bacterium]